MNIISIQEVRTENVLEITFHNFAELLNLVIFWNITDDVAFFSNEFRLNTPQFIRSNMKIKFEQNEEIINLASWIFIYSWIRAVFCFVLLCSALFYAFFKYKNNFTDQRTRFQRKKAVWKKVFSKMELSLIGNDVSFKSN